MELLSVIVFIGNLILIPLIILSCERRIKKQEKINALIIKETRLSWIEAYQCSEELEVANCILEDEISFNREKFRSILTDRPFAEQKASDMSDIMEEAQRRG